MEWQGEFQNVKFTESESWYNRKCQIHFGGDETQTTLVQTLRPLIQEYYWLRTSITNGVHLRASVWSLDSFMTCTSLSLQSFSFNCAGFCKSFLRSEVRRVPSIPLSQLLIRASRWFDRCPPQPELSSKNGLTLETWIFIFSDNCTMSGHIRPGLMRNRLGLRCVLPRWRRGKWDGERFGVDTGTKMKEKWKRKFIKHLPQLFELILQGGKWQNDVMMIHHKVRTANQSHPPPVAEPQLFNIHSY